MYKKSIITLFYKNVNFAADVIKIILYEKNINANYILIDENLKNDDEIKLNKNSNMLFIDRELELTDMNIISEYLEERFPHPPLFPVYPIKKAQIRGIIKYIYERFYKIEFINISKQNLIKILTNFSNELNKLIDYSIDDDFDMLDCYIAPILYNLNNFGISFEKDLQLKKVIDLHNKIINRESVKSLIELKDSDLFNFNLFSYDIYDY